MAALSCVLMLVSYFPYLTYAVPAVAGLCVMAVLIEAGALYAFLCYVSASVLSFLIAEKEAAFMFICLFGFYPIVKAFIERIRKSVPEWIIKILLFNACAVVSYYAVTLILGVPAEEFAFIGKYGIYIFLALCNVAFVLYDIALSKTAVFYMQKIHGIVKKIFKK